MSGSWVVTSTGDIQPSTPGTAEPSQAQRDAPSDADGSGGQNPGNVPAGQASGRQPAPQRNRGGSGQQGGGDRPPTSLEPIRPQRPLDTNTVMRMIQNGEFVIDAHVHSMEYTGKYFNNADRCSQWSLGFPENTPFGGFIDVYHDPAVWNFPAQNNIDHPVAYVNRRYGHILPPTKRLECAVACHPKFAHPKFSRAVYGTEVVRAAIVDAIKNKIDFYGSPILCIGEFGLEFGTSDEEKTARFTDVSPAQKELFRMHMELAMKYRFPIMLHIRGRDPDVQDKLEMMAINLLLDKGFPQDLPIIRHTYCGSRSRAMDWLKEFPNTYFSYSKASMKWKSSKRCMSEFDVPLDRTIVETDAPLLDFDQNQGLRRNDPRRIPAHSDDVLVVLKELQSARNLTMEDVIAKCTLNTIEAFSIPSARLEASLVCPPPVRVEQQDSRDYRHFYPQARPQYERRQDQPDEDSDSHDDDDDPDQPRGSGTGGGKATSRGPPRGTSGQGAKTSRRRQEFPQHGEDFGDDAGTASGRRVSDLRETYSPALPRTSRRQTREERGRERMERDLDRQRRQARRADEDDASWQNPYDEPNPLERKLEAVTAARREAMRQRELREQQDSPLQQQHDRLPPPPAPPALIPPPPRAGGAGTVPPPPRQIPPPPPAANQQQAQAQQDQPIQMEQDQQQDEPEVDPDTLTIYLLPRRPTKLSEGELTAASLKFTRDQLRIIVVDSTATGFELLKECFTIHNNSCKGYTYGQELSALKPQAIERLPEAIRPKAEEAAEAGIPSELHTIIVFWATKLPDKLMKEKYDFILHAINTRAHHLLELLEGFLKQLLRNGVNKQDLPPLTNHMIYYGVKIWTYCCRFPWEQTSRRRTVGPITYKQTVPEHYSRFLRGLWEFLQYYIPRGIDERRASVQDVDNMRVVNERYVFIGDTGAAALASRLNRPSGMYFECYTWIELMDVLEHTYFGHVVERVLISMGRADLPKDTMYRGQSTYRERVHNFVTRCMSNFAHVCFYFLHAPYTHVSREAWLAHVLPNARDSSSTGAEVSDMRGVAIFPEWFAKAATRSTDGFGEYVQNYLDEEGNLTPLGLNYLVKHMSEKLQVDFLDDIPAEGGQQLEPPIWDREALTEGAPRGQRVPPIGPADLVLLGNDAVVGDHWLMIPPVEDQPTTRNVAPAARQQDRPTQAQRQQDRPTQAQRQQDRPAQAPIQQDRSTAATQQAQPPLDQLGALSLGSTSAGTSATATPLSQQPMFQLRQQDKPLSGAPPPPSQIPQPPPGFAPRGAPPGFIYPGGSDASVQAPAGLLTGSGAGFQFQAPAPIHQLFGPPQNFPVFQQPSLPQQDLPQMGQPQFPFAAPIQPQLFGQPPQLMTVALSQQQILALMQMGLWPPPPPTSQ